MHHRRNNEVEAFNDAVDNSMKGHIDALYLPQASAPFSPGNGVCVPQRLYTTRSNRDVIRNRRELLFILEDGLYLPVTMALMERYTGLMDRNSQVLAEAAEVVKIRMEWPGYQSKVYRLRTLVRGTLPRKITLSQLATRISDIIRQFIVETEREQIDPNFAQWKVGQNGIQVRHLRLAALEQVATGSWQVRLFYTPPR